MFIFDILFFSIGMYIYCCVLYLMILTVGAFFYHPPRGEDDRSIPAKVLFVIPAHNEELLIRQTVERILAQDYDEHSFGVLVLADNCVDQTAERAKEAGADLVVRDDPAERGKGQALDWLFRTQQERFADWDLISIVDADTEVAPNFCHEMANAFADPAVYAAQAYYGTSNAGAAWRTALQELALRAFHHLRPAGRCALRASAGLKGNGMCFRRELIMQRGWPAHSIVEDVEFSLQLVLEGVRVYYVPQTEVLAEMPVSGQQAESQRTRWESGRIGLIREYGMKLLGRTAKGDGVALDALLDLLVPPLGLLVLLLLAFLLCSVFFYPVAVDYALAGLVGIVIYVVSSLFLRKTPLYLWFALGFAPFYLGWKICVYIKMLFSRGVRWTRTQRNAETNSGK
ncbi:glycosyltransferase family 2 protein [Desulfobaculum bizertense]|uniref:glycosyltransferase family 2 protein n=1 Tax=Desulfobaculum bizertense TaxID=376490 RepID=UPI001F3C4F2E|nr:glycosyltransferase family 2 protein [Desulfobaculum bizertense]UIJ39299.1 glycosyltransferase family 2 protein [Desulfobaculum bizertense]